MFHPIPRPNQRYGVFIIQFQKQDVNTFRALGWYHGVDSSLHAAPLIFIAALIHLGTACSPRSGSSDQLVSMRRSCSVVADAPPDPKALSVWIPSSHPGPDSGIHCRLCDYAKPLYAAGVLALQRFG